MEMNRASAACAAVAGKFLEIRGMGLEMHNCSWFGANDGGALLFGEYDESQRCKFIPKRWILGKSRKVMEQTSTLAAALLKCYRIVGYMERNKPRSSVLEMKKTRRRKRKEGVHMKESDWLLRVKKLSLWWLLVAVKSFITSWSLGRIGNGVCISDLIHSIQTTCDCTYTFITLVWNVREISFQET